MTVLELHIDGKLKLRKEIKRAGNHYRFTTYEEKIEHEIKLLRIMGRRLGHWEIFRIRKSKMNNFKKPKVNG